MSERVRPGILATVRQFISPATGKTPRRRGAWPTAGMGVSTKRPPIIAAGIRWSR
jgi:hypothetical protein